MRCSYEWNTNNDQPYKREDQCHLPDKCSMVLSIHNHCILWINILIHIENLYQAKSDVKEQGSIDIQHAFISTWLAADVSKHSKQWTMLEEKIQIRFRIWSK